MRRNPSASHWVIKCAPVVNKPDKLVLLDGVHAVTIDSMPLSGKACNVNWVALTL